MELANSDLIFQHVCGKRTREEEERVETGHQSCDGRNINGHFMELVRVIWRIMQLNGQLKDQPQFCNGTANDGNDGWTVTTHTRRPATMTAKSVYKNSIKFYGYGSILKAMNLNSISFEMKTGWIDVLIPAKWVNKDWKTVPSTTCEIPCYLKPYLSKIHIEWAFILLRGSSR